MPKYVNFMNDILPKIRKLGQFKIVALIEECNVIVQRKHPQKLTV